MYRYTGVAIGIHVWYTSGASEGQRLCVRTHTVMLTYIHVCYTSGVREGQRPCVCTHIIYMYSHANIHTCMLYVRNP